VAKVNFFSERALSCIDSVNAREEIHKKWPGWGGGGYAGPNPGTRMALAISQQEQHRQQWQRVGGHSEHC
jgi:hypothetical protein